LVHIIEPSFLVGDVENLALPIPQHALAENAKGKLLSMAAREIEELVPVRIEVRMGSSFDLIAAVAKETDADLIIIATHGYIGLKHLLLGSTAELVMRHAPCPVLTVREREREFV
jgi:universal stress protein A